MKNVEHVVDLLRMIVLVAMNLNIIIKENVSIIALVDSIMIKIQWNVKHVMLIVLVAKVHLTNNVYLAQQQIDSQKTRNASYLLIVLLEHMQTQLDGCVKNVLLEVVQNVVIILIVKHALQANIKIYQQLVGKDIAVMINIVINVLLMVPDVQFVNTIQALNITQSKIQQELIIQELGVVINNVLRVIIILTHLQTLVKDAISAVKHVKAYQLMIVLYVPKVDIGMEKRRKTVLDVQMIVHLANIKIQQLRDVNCAKLLNAMLV